MAVIRITKQFTFEMAHALADYDGLCKNIHGHSYKMDVTVKGLPVSSEFSPKKGMLIDFGDLKKIVHETIINKVDHALVLNNTTYTKLLDLLKENFEKIVVVPYQPTTENMLEDFANRLIQVFPDNIKLYSIRIRETDSSYAEWFADDN
ncbi:MAG: 6-carboxytetrahydropterin synthase [Bacteroidales bacterium]